MTDFILGLIVVGVWSLMLLYGLGFLWSGYDNVEETDEYHDWFDIYVAKPVTRFIFKPILHGVGMVLCLFVVLSYPMALVRWFVQDLHAFWDGFKELVWVLIPFVNIIYVWEWWVKVFFLIFFLPPNLALNAL